MSPLKKKKKKEKKEYTNVLLFSPWWEEAKVEISLLILAIFIVVYLILTQCFLDSKCTLKNLQVVTANIFMIFAPPKNCNLLQCDHVSPHSPIPLLPKRANSSVFHAFVILKLLEQKVCCLIQLVHKRKKKSTYLNICHRMF